MACPICSKPSVPAYRPFCSKRCADVDLAKWLRGDYVIPGAPLEDLPGDADAKNAPPRDDFRD
ncbi:DNA gyrase inhibitor YacG [Paracoccus aestuarii]|uniref:DNA gyrase inhibitor YacG n=1 Tax=Paracoccus aestuarii TaxID=453842 RepID=A0A418ZQ83_9RHOB|nr:DNA gyrase inhibitor YacG [Paracoccus aestuarii]RJK97413.1 DNA gyrase inhibitor YacG [Paracoccus aestuarii]WCR00536.1 DNA gyrase inhibitor YacG [Paracoccus aestuarii]